MYDEEKIRRNILIWWNKYKGKVDGQTGKKLFTIDSKDAYYNAMKVVDGITDVLSRDELYTPITPSSRSKSELTSWRGARGVESKNEKNHHGWAHYANIGIRETLADGININGTAQDNVRLR